MNAVQRHWQALAPRERRLVAAAAAVVFIALVWWLALAPAVGVLRGAQEQRNALDTRLRQMTALQLQAQALQALPKQNYDDALRLLETSVRQRLGATARITLAGDRVTLTLAATPPDALAQWLTQARVNARALPREAKLNRNAAGLWDGTVVLALPPR